MAMLDETRPDPYCPLTHYRTRQNLTINSGGSGIKTCALTVVHELHHLTMRDDFYGLPDTDTDRVADVSEPTYDGISTDLGQPDTYQICQFYTDPRTGICPYPTYGDNEVRARVYELRGHEVYYPAHDWAKPGAQSIEQYGP